MKKYLLAILLLVSLATQAMHIVGGVVSYTFISGTTYEIKLTVFRDCGTSTPFDQPAILGIFQENGVLVNTVALNAPVITSILPPNDNPCLTNTIGVCVEQGVYTTTYTFPSADIPYIVTYERCCRNNSITNVVVPGDEGAAFMARIPPAATSPNNSPVFNSFPPLFVCLNSPLIINNSATDADGDQLVYNLCTPFSAGDTSLPAPNPPNGPLYNEIQWQPPYSLANLMGGTPLAIDPQTGVLTGTPNAIGQFVVGVCVSEYRNGQLLGTYLRDFQFNVTPCNTPITNIPSTDINPNTGIGLYQQNCSSNTVNFINNTYNPPPNNVPLNFSWDFGVNNITSDTSNLQSPTYNYPDSGTYLVKLIVTKGSGPNACADTTFAYVKVYPTFNTNFTFTNNICQQVTAVFTDSTITTLGNINTWKWVFGDGATATTANTAHTYTAPGVYNVSLIATNTYGCKDTTIKQITIKETPNASFAAPDVCQGAGTSFTYTGTGTLTAYNWNFGSNGATSTTASPSYTYPAAGTYTASLIAEINGCYDTVVQTTTVNPVPVAVASNDTMFCTSVTTFQLNASGGSSYAWSPATGLSNANIANPVATLAPPAAVTYTVIVSNQFQCTDTEAVSIGFYPITQVNAGIDTSICLSPGSYRDSVQLTATGMASYQWSPANTLTNANIANPVSRPAVNTTYAVLGTDVNGCRSIDSVTVFVLDPLLNIIVDDVANICIGDTGFLNVINQGASSYTWTPNQFIVNGSTYSPGFYPPDTTVYYLNVDNYCYMKNDSVIINVQPLPTLSFIVPDSLCTREVETLTVSGAQTYVWNADSTLTAGINTATPTIVPDSSQYYYVTATSQYGCVRYDSVFVIVHQLPYVYAGADTLIYRETEGVLNGVTDAGWYEWSPKTNIKDVHDLNSVINPYKSIQYLLTAIDTNGCVNRDSVIVTVEVLTIVDLPTAFSPNGDGLNDVFRIVRTLNIERLKEFAVYNRWGSKVFSTTNVLDGWNGYYLDLEQPIGTYVWMVIGNTRDSEEVLHKGNVTLVR